MFVFLFSLELQIFPLDPNPIVSIWVKFHMPILVESANRIDPACHVIKQFFRAQLVFHAGRVSYLRLPDDFDFVAN